MYNGSDSQPSFLDAHSDVFLKNEQLRNQFRLLTAAFQLRAQAPAGADMLMGRVEANEAHAPSLICLIKWVAIRSTDDRAVDLNPLLPPADAHGLLGTYCHPHRGR